MLRAGNELNQKWLIKKRVHLLQEQTSIFKDTLTNFKKSQCSDSTCLPHPLAHLLEVDVNQENDVGKQVCVGVVVLLTIGGADDERIWGGQGWIRSAFFCYRCGNSHTHHSLSLQKSVPSLRTDKIGYFRASNSQRHALGLLYWSGSFQKPCERQTYTRKQSLHFLYSGDGNLTSNEVQVNSDKSWYSTKKPKDD